MAKDTQTPVSVRLSEEEKAWIAGYAKKEDLSMSQVIRRAIKEFITRKENAEAGSIIG